MRLAPLLAAATALAAMATAAVAQDQASVAQSTPPLSSTPPWAPGAGAPPNPADTAMRQACAADTRKLCAGVQPGGGRILQCFKEHAADLSPGCKAAMVQMRSAAGGGGGARFRRRDGSVPN